MTTTDLTLNERLVARLNASVKELSKGRLMQNTEPFTVRSQGGEWEHIGFGSTVAPRDVEILCDILEAVERGERIHPDLAPGAGQASLPLD